MRPVSMVERMKKEHGEEKGEKRWRHKYYIYMDNMCSSVSGWEDDVPMRIYDCNFKYK
jgi:hypothetical protein